VRLAPRGVAVGGRWPRRPVRGGRRRCGGAREGRRSRGIGFGHTADLAPSSRRGNGPTMPAMRSGWRRAWPWLKALLAIAIVGGVGWQFARLLAQPELWDRAWHLHPAWLVVTVLTYLAGLGCWGTFWLRLLHRLGFHPSATA